MCKYSIILYSLEVLQTVLSPVGHQLLLPSDLSPALRIPSQEPISSLTFSKMSKDFVLIGQVPFDLRLTVGIHELLMILNTPSKIL